MKRILSLSLPLLAAACAQSAPNTNSVDINTAATQAQGAVDAYGSNAPVEIAEPDAPKGAADDAIVTAGNAVPALDPPAPGTPDGLPDDRTPVSEARFTPDSAQGAANVVQTYYALIGERKYAQAFALRDAATAGAPTADAFAVSFARYSEYHANVGAPSAIEAGAGQRYVTVPVQIYARLKQGATPVYEIGSVTLHRTGDIDGATAAQRSWHIRSIDVKSVPKR
uniref:hypothetical protein n=1 Tax=uncultured Sphingomonas sp. TaxID=158754 RepID=UPI0035CBD0C7